MAATKGKCIYRLYRAVSYGVSPLVHLHVRWRNPLRWPERLGRASLPRPPGPLIWFHAVSLGEGMAAIPVIRECIRTRPDLNVLLTTTTISAFEVIKNRLPSEVIYQFAPVDTPSAMDAFLGHWKPNAIVLMESELWPNLIFDAEKNGVSDCVGVVKRSDVGEIVQTVVEAVDVPSVDFVDAFEVFADCPSNTQAINFQLLCAPPFIVHFSGDLKFATEELEISEAAMKGIEDLKSQLASRRVWMAASIHKGEEEVILAVHKVLSQVNRDLVTIIVTRHPWHGKEIAQKLQKEGQHVLLRSRGDKLTPQANVYVVDTLGELRHLYRVTPIAVIGGSFFPGFGGHNVAEAAASGCAVLTGPHIGHFSGMVSEMQGLNPLSVLQVSGESELEQALRLLFSDGKVLQARRLAAKQTYRTLSTGIVQRAWNLLDHQVLKHALAKKAKTENQR